MFEEQWPSVAGTQNRKELRVYNVVWTLTEHGPSGRLHGYKVAGKIEAELPRKTRRQKKQTDHTSAAPAAAADADVEVPEAAEENPLTELERQLLAALAEGQGDDSEGDNDALHDDWVDANDVSRIRQAAAAQPNFDVEIQRIAGQHCGGGGGEEGGDEEFNVEPIDIAEVALMAAQHPSPSPDPLQ